MLINQHPTLLLALYLPLLAILEWLTPLRPLRRSRVRRWSINISLSILTYFVFWLTIRPASLFAAALSRQYSFGIFQWTNLSGPFESVLAFLLLDVSFYYWHRLNHTIPFFWRFHVVHHIDPDMDVTTAFRFHGVEIFYSSGFRFLQVLLIGADPTIATLYDLIFQLGVYFHHSNVKLPFALERGLQFIFVTPRFHSIHHTQAKHKTHSNYSVVFSLWDRIHGSLRSIEAKPDLIGIPGYDSPNDNRLATILRVPFRRQKNYWSVT